MAIGAEDLRAAARWSASVLAPAVDDGRSWDVAAGDLEMTVTEAAAHVAIGNLWYVWDLAAGGPDLAAMEPRPKADAAPAVLVAAMVNGSEVLARVLETSASGQRGFHPFGPADAEGFAAMGCDEVLVHTWDMAQGLALEAAPDPDLCARVTARLFPDAPGEPDPWRRLLWCNGRLALPGHPRREPRWTWHSAPLA